VNTGPDAPRSGPVRVILFDFDGTLADTFAEGLEILNGLAAEFNFRPLVGADVEKARDMTTRQVMKFLEVPTRKLPRISHHGVRRLRDRIHTIQPFPGVRELLAELQAGGIRIGIVTSNSEENVNTFFANHGLTKPEFVRSSSRLLGKARVIRQTMREFKFGPGETLFVGDETRDIEACKRAGLRCVAVNWGYNSQRALEAQRPFRIISTTRELLPVIQEAGAAA
jgi:phosphoglycolate phosphatase-like HAD superfamily hydrolase